MLRVNYYHLICNVLPIITYFQENNEKADLVIVGDDNSVTRQYISLISPSMDILGLRNKSIALDRAVAPTQYRHNDTLDQRAINAGKVARHILQSTKLMKMNLPRKIFIERRIDSSQSASGIRRILPSQLLWIAWNLLDTR